MAWKRRAGAVFRRHVTARVTGVRQTATMAGHRRRARSNLVVGPAPIAEFALPEVPESLREMRFIGRRPRQACVSGVAWTSPTTLVTVSLVSSRFDRFDFDPASGELAWRGEVETAVGVNRPENVDVSADGRLLAVANASASADVHVHRLDPTTGAPVPSIAPLVLHDVRDRNPHGVALSPDGTLLVYSTVDNPGVVRSFRCDDDGHELRMTPLPTFESPFDPLKVKGVAITRCGRWLLLCHSPNARYTASRTTGGRVSAHRITVDGIDPEPVSVRSTELGLLTPDDLTVFPDGRLLVTDQGVDAALVVDFDPDTGLIGERLATLAGPTSRLSFPHGCAASPDGRFVAVANHGSNALTVHAVAPATALC